MSSSPTSEIRLCCETKEIRRCRNGAEALSIDGHDFSCRMKSCPPGYSCETEICCPLEEFACSEAIYAGTSCDGDSSSSVRFYFDRISLSCRSFDYRGCNPGANTWKDEQSCESACLSTTLRCPSQFTNPPDAPQFCEQSRPSCGPIEQCVPLTNGMSVCCIPKTVQIAPTPPPSSLKTLMLSICGPGKVPWVFVSFCVKISFRVKQNDGDPRRCSKSRPCGMRQQCVFSPILMMDICCVSGRL